MRRNSSFLARGLAAGPVRGLLVLAFVTPLIALAGCRSAPPPPDLGPLYNHVAQHHDELRNPVIVIPGILGTRLEDPVTGKVVWGAFGGGAANPQKPDGAPLVALPMAEGASLRDLRDEVVTDGVLDRLKMRLAGLPFQLEAYVQILATLGVGGYRDQQIHYPDQQIDYGDDHFTCFQFDYDWRRDNVENAQRLHRFLLEKREFVRQQRIERFGNDGGGVRFDIIAHSMGGLVLRYLLRFGDSDLPADGSTPAVSWGGAPLVEKAILIGTPSAGSMEALMQLVDGRKFGPMTPRYEAPVLGTFPSIFQLLPRPRHGALVAADAPDEYLDFMDPELWEEYGWGLAATEADTSLEMLLPDKPAAERRRIAREHLAKSLRRAKQFHAALDQPASSPPGTELYLVAGDAVATARTASLDRATGRLTLVEEGPGDGTVLRTSALMDERAGRPWQPSLRSPVDWENVLFLFSDHLGMTKDPMFKDNVLYLLLEAPRSDPPVGE